MLSNVLFQDTDLRKAIVGNPLIVRPDCCVDEAIALMSYAWSTCAVQPSKGVWGEPSQVVHASCVLVRDGTQLIGILTERDIVRLSASGEPFRHKKLHEVMTSPVQTRRCSELTNIYSALEFLRQHQIRHLPILDDAGSVLGLLTQESLRQLLQPLDLLRLRKVREVMTRQVVQVSQTVPVHQVAQLMCAHRISCIVVVETVAGVTFPVGILTEWDIVQLQSLELNLTQIQIQQVMSTPVFSVKAGDSLWSAHMLMCQKHLRRVLVTGESGELQGIITQTTLLQSLNPTEIYKLVELLEQKVALLEAEKIDLLQNQNTRLEQQLQEQNQALELQVQQVQQQLVKEKLVEERLHQSEATNRVIIQAIPDLLIRIDCNGYYRGLLSRGSVRAITPPKGVEKPSIYDVFPKELVEQKLFHVRKALATGELQIFEQRIEFGGTVRYEEVRMAALNSEEVLAIVRDITERKRAELALHHLTQELESRVEARTAALQASEAQLRRFNEQLESANQELARVTRLKDEFLANMSHELRTPLNAILGFSEGLKEGVFGGINDRQRRAISTIESSGEHLLELINDILDLAKIESGKLELSKSTVSLQALCEKVLVLIRQQAQRKNIDLHVVLPETPIQFLADERRLRQVLLNLLTNAIKFTPEKGQIILRVWLLDGAIQFEVEDTGIGIAAEDLPKLFQPFVQIDSSLNRQYTGTGLGLALVRRIVELHQGEVRVQSQLSRGSCFTVVLPYEVPDKSRFTTADPSEQTPPVQSFCTTPTALTTSETRHKPLILLAEDNGASIETVVDYLSNFNYRLLVAKNGLEAIALAKSSAPDLILMDIQMAEMDGLEAMQRIKADPTLAHIPIVALTALAMPGDEERCLQAGAVCYFAKPLLLRQLLETLQQILS